MLGGLLPMASLPKTNTGKHKKPQPKAPSWWLLKEGFVLGDKVPQTESSTPFPVVSRKTFYSRSDPVWPCVIGREQYHIDRKIKSHFHGTSFIYIICNSHFSLPCDSQFVPLRICAAVWNLIWQRQEDRVMGHGRAWLNIKFISGKPLAPFPFQKHQLGQQSNLWKLYFSFAILSNICY